MKSTLKFYIQFIITYFIITKVVAWMFGPSDMRSFLILIGMIFTVFINMIRAQWRDRYLIKLYKIQEKVIMVETVRELFELRRQLQDLGYVGMNYLSDAALDKVLKQIDNRIKNEFQITWTTLK
jgi:hypothetical protein